MRVLAAAAAIAALSTGVAQASTLVASTGSIDQAVVFGPDEGLGFVFTLTEGVANVDIAAFVDCTDCEGLVTLNRDGFGPDAAPSQTVAAAVFDAGASDTFLTGEAGSLLPTISFLPPGDYYLLVSIEAGSASFFSTFAQSVVTGLGAQFAFDIVVDDLRPGFFPGSDFEVRLTADELLFSVTGDAAVSPVPVPPAAALFLAPLLVGAARRLRA